MTFVLSQFSAKAFAILAAATTCPATPVTPSIRIDAVSQPLQISEWSPAPGSSFKYGSADFKMQYMSIDVNFLTKPVQETGQTCLYVDNVVAHFQMGPVVYVDEKYPPGSCMYDSIRKYFQGLLTQLQITFNNYQATFGTIALEPLRYAPPPAPLNAGDVAARENAIKASLDTSVRRARDEMYNAVKQRYEQIEDQRARTIDISDCK